MYINDLPPEVLGEIFTEALALIPLGHSTHRGYIIRRSHRWEPLNFVHVCRYWREIALSMQTLWTSIDATKFKGEALIHWLSFARSSPLHLAYWPLGGLKWGKPVDDKTLRKSEELLRHFPLCADRWDSLYFRVQNFELTEAFAKMLKIAAPHSPLRIFEIEMKHDGTPPRIIETLTSAISSFPSLRHLSWTFNSIQITLPRVLQWNVLETVYVNACIEVEDFMWCLTQCTSARNVTLLGIGRESKRRVTNAFDNVQCILPRLNFLTINECCDPHRLLQHFTLPSLVYLEIQAIYGTSNVLQDFLVRSQSPLQTFKLEVDNMKKEDVIGCLLTPSLQSVASMLVSLVFIGSEPYLADIVQRRPDILRTLPKLTAWRDRTGHNIGWKTSGEEIVRPPGFNISGGL